MFSLSEISQNTFSTSAIIYHYFLPRFTPPKINIFLTNLKNKTDFFQDFVTNRIYKGVYSVNIIQKFYKPRFIETSSFLSRLSFIYISGFGFVRDPTTIFFFSNHIFLLFNIGQKVRKPVNIKAYSSSSGTTTA